jgi:tol-pal system protein YbgF
MQRASRAVAVAAALLLSAGCATKRDLRDLRAEIRALSARQDTILAALARQNTVTQDTLRQQTNQLFEIRGDVSRQLQRIMDDLSRLTELTGQNQRAIASIRDQLEGLRMRAAAPAPVGEAIVGGQPGGDPGAAEGLYATAMGLYGEPSTRGTALNAFRDFVQQYPNHERAPDALWYMGDVLAQQEQTEAALDAFDRVLELHPASARVPDALYRKALLLIEEGERDEARTLLERVVESYPASMSAAPARAVLRELR